MGGQQAPDNCAQLSPKGHVQCQGIMAKLKSELLWSAMLTALGCFLPMLYSGSSLPAKSRTTFTSRPTSNGHSVPPLHTLFYLNVSIYGAVNSLTV